jgi:hypothetical protein
MLILKGVICSRESGRLTFFNAILARMLLIHWLSVTRAGNALHTLLEVVFVRSTCLRFLAFYRLISICLTCPVLQTQFHVEFHMLSLSQWPNFSQVISEGAARNQSASKTPCPFERTVFQQDLTSSTLTPHSCLILHSPHSALRLKKLWRLTLLKLFLWVYHLLLLLFLLLGLIVLGFFILASFLISSILVRCRSRGILQNK